MPAQIFGAAAAVSILNRAFANTSLAYSTYNNQVEAAKATLKAGDSPNNVLSYVTFAKDFGAAYATKTPEALSTLLLTNMGVLPSTVPAVAALEPALTDYIKSNGADKIGIIALQLGNIFTTLETAAAPLDVYNAAAVAWNNEITAAHSYSSNAGNTIDQVGEQAVDGGENGIPLTNKTDNLSGNKFSASQVYTPGGDDRINSLQDEDVLTGTGTKPTLNADLGNANDNGATIITPKLVNIEVANLKFTGSGNAVVALDVQDATGLKEVNIERVSQASNMARVENIKQVLTNMSIASTNANNAGVVEFSFGAGVLAGDNTAAVKVDNVQIGTVNIGNNISVGGAAPVASAGVGNQGYETISLESTGASNAIGTLNLPMDTGTAGKVTITGDKNLTLAAPNGVRNGNTVESTVYGGGIALANGRLATVDATALTGNLTLNVGAGFLTTGKAGTSGVVQNVSVLLGKGDDKVILSDRVEAGDSLSAGEGTDTLILTSNAVVNATSSVLTGFENVEIRAALGGAVVADFDKLPDTKLTLVRNEGSDGVSAPSPKNLSTTLNNLTKDQAAALLVQHSNTGSNALVQNVITANLKDAKGAADLVSLTVDEGVNTDPRFNVELSAKGMKADEFVESITLVDKDSESNTVKLTNFANHTNTITIGTAAGGGVAGGFLNLDATANALRLDLNGGDKDSGGWSKHTRSDVGAGPAERLIAAVIDASAEKANVALRVSDGPNETGSQKGAQKITLGSGDDVLIFDQIKQDATNSRSAGLTISDTVSGGEGKDTLALDGHGNKVFVGASEWTNVTGFETIALYGNEVPDNNARGTNNSNAYNLTLTNDLLKANGTVGADGIKRIAVINDNDADNKDIGVADTADSGRERGVTIDATDLNASNSFSYDGEEGASLTADRFIFRDVNINGTAQIDGGAVRGAGNIASNLANADVIEVQDKAEVTVGDLVGISNVGTFEFVNISSTNQNAFLGLDDVTVDALVNTTRKANFTTGIETLTVRAFDSETVAAAHTNLTVDATGVTSNGFKLDIATQGGADKVKIHASSAGPAAVLNLGGQDGALEDVVELWGGLATDALGINAAGNLTITNKVTAQIREVVLTGVETIDVSNWNGSAADKAALVKSSYLFVDGVTPRTPKVQYTLTADSVATAEGNAGVTKFNFALKLDQAAQSDFTVNFSTTNGTATAGEDYTAVTNGTVTFLKGATTATATVDVSGDTKDEANETFTVNFTGNSLKAAASATATIVNDEGVALTIGQTTTTAATANADNFTFNVAPAKTATTVTAATITGFAVANDMLTIDSTTALGSVKLSALNGVDGVSVQPNPITNSTLINFGGNVNGDVISITLAGVVDPALVNINVI